MSDKPHVVIVDDEPNVRKVLGALLEQGGFATSQGASGEEGLQLVRAQDPDLVLTDLKMPGMDGLELLRRLRSEFPEIPVIILTAHGTVEAAVDAMKQGAHDFLTKPFEKGRVLEIIRHALAQAEKSRREFHGPLAHDARFGIIGRSPAMAAVTTLVERVGPSPSTVLITGETGTGKELVAEALHRLSPRSGGPMVRINCGALPANLVESELFGHERGAYTGADRARPGRFELAHGGTLFLDEIGELPLTAQATLLRVVDDGVVERVGATQSRRVDVRLIAATNRDLEEEIRKGGFRQDLLYRLRVMEIHIPPLRDRLEDIPLLVEFFLDKQSRRLDRPRPRIMSEALQALQNRSWPGNVRELENAIERALLLAGGSTIGAFELGLSPGASRDDDTVEPDKEGMPRGIKGAAHAAAAEAERRLIRAALEITGGNVTRAAERLALSRRGLQLKMKALGLQRDIPDS